MKTIKMTVPKVILEVNLLINIIDDRKLAD